ncbi:glycosyltransferase family 4 protein [Rhizobium sp. BE258]|uniref:glycosyltransferase family 4 protein n=1 Tax=Rhizobium sp. BE258 TaxID=2817722 RepID=UPI0028599298|nr:glycosyltransferase family 4 protein [Rhizobium sp. BE258]MDR7145218.1 glycosyltransferase involved in cell wall biosynthesis [Rhizobium sp. BE258]
MKVIVFPQLYGVHGIARYLQSFLKNSTSDEILVLAGDQDLFDLKVPANVTMVNLPMPSGRFGLVRWSLHARSFLKRLAKTKRISSINLHIPPLIPGLLLPRVAPIVVTAHTTYLGMAGKFYSETQYKSQWSSLSVFVKMLFERVIFAKSSSIITLTEQGRQELARYGYSKPVHIYPNGVALSEFTPANVEKDIDVLFVGRVERRKGSRSMVDVCKALILARPGIKIGIVGYGDDFDYVSSELGPLSNNVLLAGKQPFEKVLNYYRRSKIYASTSHYEGLPGTCLEAMAVGVPAIVWKYLFYEKLVEPEKNGLVVEVNQIDKFRDAVLSLLEDRERLSAFGERAREHIAEKYNWAALAPEIETVL